MNTTPDAEMPDEDVFAAMVSVFVKEYFTQEKGWERRIDLLMMDAILLEKRHDHLSGGIGS